jgi:putative Holliday junction resolvase
MMFLGIDYGRAHVGLAIGDTETKMAFPHKTFSGLPRHSLLEELRTLVKTNRVERIIVGRPRAIHGGEGTLEKEVEEFSQQVRMTTDVPVQLVDERFTSDAAQKLRHQNPSADEHALAAMLILQFYFDTLV